MFTLGNYTKDLFGKLGMTSCDFDCSSVSDCGGLTLASCPPGCCLTPPPQQDRAQDTKTRRSRKRQVDHLLISVVFDGKTN